MWKEAICLLLFVYHLYAADIIGCGGFVKSNVPINFASVEVKLYSSQGSFKSKTECAPNNGYFLVAIYDHGDYILKIDSPDGWSFVPQEIQLKVDGLNDPCSQGKDLNFKFTGFTVAGKVTSLNRDEGPSDVAVALQHKDDGILATESTDDTGKFAFKNILPGDYVVKASHHTWKFKNDEADVTVVDNNENVGNQIIVAGFDVKGHVLSSGEPIQGVSFILLSENVARKDVLDCGDVLEDILKSVKFESKGNVLCVSVSKRDGSFLFSTVPSGKYVLIPFYTSQNIVFDILPQKLSFMVNYKSVELKTPFQVYGFSVQGKVVDKQGIGIEGTSIRALRTGVKEKKVVTGVDGMYLLENITTGHYVFKLEKEHHFFDDENIHITPNTPKLKDIIVKKYHICGLAEVFHTPNGVLGIHQHKVLLNPEGGKNSAIISTSPDENGNFCFDVEPGTYKLEIPLMENEKKRGFLLNPSQLTVNVIAEPILNVKFTQFRAVIKGIVHCIEDCSEVTVYMVRNDQSMEKVYAKVEIMGFKVHFTFKNVLPGTYKVIPQRKKWCWNPSNVEVEVKNSDITNLELNHSGYYLRCSVSHNITLNFKLTDKVRTVGSFELIKGSNQFCLKTPGHYSLTPISCYRFENDVYSYNTYEPTTLSLMVKSYKLIMKISTLIEIHDMKINIKSLSSHKEDVITPHLKKFLPEESVFTYEAIYWGGLAEEFIITPYSKEILFYPDVKSVSISENCPGGSADFKGQEGKFIEGQVLPPFESVSITISITGSEKHGRRLVEVLTDVKGLYKFGPVHSDIQYDVTAVKEGYHIAPQPGQRGSFIAQKLAHITVKVLDEWQSGMGSVLLSLSGGQYRNNNLTLTNGSFSFSNLRPGQYFLRPMQKEYSFNPSSKMIEVAEGEDMMVEIVGKRVAFSCGGTLYSLSGNPESKVGVEAIGLDECLDYHESAISDEHGHYRLRGLQPGCAFIVRLMKSDDTAHIERFAPVDQIVHIQQGDVMKVNFVVFMKPKKFHLTAQIDTDFELLSSIKVLLFDGDNMDSPLQIVNPGVVKYVQFPPLKPKTYVVKLQSTMSSSTHETRSTSATVTPDEDLNEKHVRLKFEAKERQVIMEPTQSIIALPLAVAFVFLAYNYDTVLIFLFTLNSFIHNLNRGGSSDADSDDDEIAKSSRKKRR